MPNEIVITCFTDIKDSTSLTEQLGNDGFSPIRKEYSRVCHALAEANKITFKKGNGDGDLITFRDMESSLLFAAQLQQYYQAHPNFTIPPISLRIGLFLGTVEIEKCDVFGSGVNQASRVEGKAEPGEIWVNDDYYKFLSTVWNETKVERYFINKGNHVLKGIKKTVVLYSFKWTEFAKDFPEKTLAELVKQRFDSASVIMHNLSTKDIANQPTIIWPVVPRNGVNAIHCGQLEIIRLLAMLGSKVKVLIADCGAPNSPTKQYSEDFIKQIHQHALKRGIQNIEYKIMSDMLTPGCDGCDIFHTHFQNVVTSMTLETMQKIVYKDYDSTDRDRIQRYTTLYFLRPALTISLVLNLTDQGDGKSIVIAGYDEKDQWEKAHNAIKDAPDRFGVLFNPILKGKEGHQSRQTGDSFRYFSPQGIIDDMARHYLATWLVKFPLFLSQFPSETVNIGDDHISPDAWDKDKDIEAKINKEKMAQDVYTNILTC